MTSTRLQRRDDGTVCRTIDSLLGKFCICCGTKDNVVETEGALRHCICPECAEASRLDAIDQEALVAKGPPTTEEWEAMKKIPWASDLDYMLATVRREHE